MNLPFLMEQYPIYNVQKLNEYTLWRVIEVHLQEMIVLFLQEMYLKNFSTYVKSIIYILVIFKFKSFNLYIFYQLNYDFYFINLINISKLTNWSPSVAINSMTSRFTGNIYNTITTKINPIIFVLLVDLNH